MRRNLAFARAVSFAALATGLVLGSAAHAQTSTPPTPGGDQAEQASQPADPPAAPPQTEPAPAPASSDNAGEIVVTGSRIQQTGMASPTPVTMLSQQDFNNLAPGNVAEALDKLPAFLNSPSTSGDASSGVSDAGGTNLNLRGLGTARTLTLLNGRRVVPNNKEGAVNIDIFPNLIVKRIDIVTGGASAAYGTDAVAGVVNFILDTDFTGFKGDIQGGISKQGDDANGQVELAWGGKIGEKLHLVVSGEYSREGSAGVLGDRDWYQSYSLITNPAYAANRTLPIYLTEPHVVGTNFTCGGLVISPNAAINGMEFTANGTQKFVKSAISASGSGTNNAQSLANASGGSGCDPKRKTPLLAPQEKAHIYANLNYDVADDVRLYLQGLFSHDSADFGSSSTNMAPPYNATIYSGNPFIPADIQALMTANNIASFQLGRDNTDIFPNESNDTIVRNRSFLITGGVDATLHTGSVFDGWKISAYGQYSQNHQRASFYGKEIQGRLYIAQDAVRNSSGQIVCRAALLNPQQYGDCVPLNLMGPGLASPDAIAYVTSPGPGDPNAIVFHYNLKQVDAEASASGDVFKGIGAGAVTAAFGLSYRRQEVTSYQTGLSAELGPTAKNGDLGVRGLPSSVSGDPDQQFFDSFSDVEGSITVKEAFGEINFPLLKDKPFAQSLVADVAARVADYSGSGTIWAYKGGLEWQVIPDIKFRGTYSRDVRAATLSERYDSQRTNGTVQIDPVVGFPASGQTYNFSQTTGGNPNVAPEKADTYTLGVVLTPTFVRGLAVSVDYYNVKIQDAINQLGTQNIVNQCAAGSADLCALITRDPTTGFITDLKNIYINIARETASGLDVEIDYHRPLRLLGGGAESIALRGLASFLFDRSLALPGSSKLQLAGQVATTTAGDDFAYLKLQMTGNIVYKNGPFELTVQERYLNGGNLNNLYVQGVDVDDNRVSPVWYTDLGITYSVNKAVDVFGYVTNLFDRSPPIAAEPWTTLGGSVQTNKQLYDFIGQRFLLGVRFNF